MKYVVHRSVKLLSLASLHHFGLLPDVIRSKNGTIVFTLPTVVMNEFQKDEMKKESSYDIFLSLDLYNSSFSRTVLTHITRANVLWECPRSF